MSNTYLEALASERSHNVFLRKVIACSMLAGAFGTYVAYTVPKTIDVHLAPDIRAGSVVEIKNGVGYIPPENVYSFAYYIWQQLNRWQEDGMKDYPKQLYNLQSFITAKCQAEIKDDMKNRAKNSELLQRTRLITEIPGFSFAANRVIAEGSAVWTVFLDMQLQETYRGQNVKDTFIRYPLRLVRYDVDRERNPWGLGLDCFSDQPQRLDIAQVKEGKVQALPASTNTAPLPTVVPADVAARTATPPAPAQVTPSQPTH
jgi:integrating conjugative element protein (TIGR03746 family)